MARPFVLLALLMAIVLPSRAEARDVYFNGVKLEPHVVIKNQKFEACEVRFDAEGNIYITAKGYKVNLAPVPESGGAAAKDGGKAAPANNAEPPKLTKRYWLVAPQTKRGLVQYDVDVYVNGNWVKKIKSGDDKAVLEVTKHVKAGHNVVKVIAVKNMGDKRASASPQDVMDVILGEGSLGGGTITIDRPVVTYKRNASETQNFADDYGFDSR